MSLIYDLRKIERANKANSNKEHMLLSVCERYMPEERKNVYTYIIIIKWIDGVWRDFARQHGMREDAFRKLVREKCGDVYSLFGWD